MKEETRKIYTLKHNSVLDNVETPILFFNSDGEKTEKVTLTEIDAYTTNFMDRYELMDVLNSLGYKFYNSHFFIEYRHNNQRKKTNLVYSDQNVLREFAINNYGQNKVKMDDLFYRYLYKVINVIGKDMELMRYLRDNHYLSRWLKLNIEEYNVYKEDDVESSYISLKRIKQELSRYKVIRDLEIGIKEYEMQKEFMQNLNNRKKVIIKQKTKEKKPRHFAEGQGQLFDPDNY